MPRRDIKDRLDDAEFLRHMCDSYMLSYFRNRTGKLSYNRFTFGLPQHQYMLDDYISRAFNIPLEMLQAFYYGRCGYECFQESSDDTHSNVLWDKGHFKKLWNEKYQDEWLKTKKEYWAKRGFKSDKEIRE